MVGSVNLVLTTRDTVTTIEVSMMKRKPAIIAYDIHSSWCRRRVYRCLQAWRVDGQLSVHECLLSEREAEELYLQLGALIDPATDKLLLAWLAPNSLVYGRGTGQVDSLFRRWRHIG
jgi:CRISPR-associated protein Cas2